MILKIEINELRKHMIRHEEFIDLYPGKSILKHEETGQLCLLEAFVCNRGEAWDGYWLRVTKDIHKKIDWQKLLESKELSEDELEGEVYDFEVVDFGYDRNKQ